MPVTEQRPRTNGVAQIPPTYRPPASRDDNSGYWAAFSLLLGMLVVALGAVALWMGFSAHDARNDANKAVSAASGGGSMPGMNMGGASTSGGSELQSFAGQGPANADALAKKHVAMNAALPPAPAGPVARVHLVLVDTTIEIAPGVKYAAWHSAAVRRHRSSTFGKGRGST